MKKLFLFIGLVAFLATACEKEEMVTPFEQQEDPLAEVIRIAQEGAAMLGDAETRSAVGRRIDRSRISCKINPATRAGESDDTLYYVVNYADNAGFAIVSANEEAPDGARLIAVTESGSYTAGEQTENEGFNMYMDMVANSREIIDIPIIRDTLPGYDLGEEVIEDYYSDWTTVGPYIQVKWGQGKKDNNIYNPLYPYNYFCYTSSTQLCPAGCVTVAIAQIMSFYKKPSSYMVTWNGTKVTRPINWNTLCSYVGGPNGMTWPSQVAEEIAMLFREIGKRASMTYTPSSSSATILGARESFAGFGYDQNPEQAHNIAVIKSELNAGRPVCEFAYGYSVSGGTPIYGGHAWAIDGYKSRIHYYKRYIAHNGLILSVLEERATTYNYLHMNWGYDGRNNGYFLNNVFDSLDGYDYDSDNYYHNNSDFDYRDNPLIVTGIWNDDIN